MIFYFCAQACRCILAVSYLCWSFVSLHSGFLECQSHWCSPEQGWAAGHTQTWGPTQTNQSHTQGHCRRLTSTWLAPDCTDLGFTLDLKLFSLLFFLKVKIYLYHIYIYIYVYIYIYIYIYIRSKTSSDFTLQKSQKYQKLWSHSNLA